MAILTFSMNVSLDGYVDHTAFAPGPALFRHWVGHVAGLAGSLYGARLYGLMRYWDSDDPGWSADHLAFAAAWRAMPKWVVTSSAEPLGPNATRVTGDLETAVRGLKDRHEGEIATGGPILAHSLGTLGLIDAYHLYLRPLVLGQGTPYFAGPRPPLRLVSHDRVGEDAVRLTYVPA
jgi:dihydrofolate reductase